MSETACRLLTKGRNHLCPLPGMLKGSGNDLSWELTGKRAYPLRVPLSAPSRVHPGSPKLRHFSIVLSLWKIWETQILGKLSSTLPVEQWVKGETKIEIWECSEINENSEGIGEASHAWSILLFVLFLNSLQIIHSTSIHFKQTNKIPLSHTYWSPILGGAEVWRQPQPCRN